MSVSSPKRNKALPLSIQQALDSMFARGSGFSGPQILDFFSQNSNSIESYSWSGRAPSRWLIFEDCLAQFDLVQQKNIIRDLLGIRRPNEPWKTSDWGSRKDKEVARWCRAHPYFHCDGGWTAKLGPRK